MTASAMLVAQKAQRQVVFSVIKAPAIGPTAGPRRGAKLYTAEMRISGHVFMWRLDVFIHR